MCSGAEAGPAAQDSASHASGTGGRDLVARQTCPVLCSLSQHGDVPQDGVEGGVDVPLPLRLRSWPALLTHGAAASGGI
jgi:hypothetical protein